MNLQETGLTSVKFLAQFTGDPSPITDKYRTRIQDLRQCLNNNWLSIVRGY